MPLVYFSKFPLKKFPFSLVTRPTDLFIACAASLVKRESFFFSVRGKNGILLRPRDFEANLESGQSLLSNSSHNVLFVLLHVMHSNGDPLFPLNGASLAFKSRDVDDDDPRKERRGKKTLIKIHFRGAEKKWERFVIVVSFYSPGKSATVRRLIMTHCSHIVRTDYKCNYFLHYS